MCAKFGCGPTVVSKKGGGVQTDRQTGRQRFLQLYIVDDQQARAARISGSEQRGPLGRYEVQTLPWKSARAGSNNIIIVSSVSAA